MASYDRAITTFSPDGHLFQVEYAGEAVKKGLCAVGVRGEDTVVLAVEKRAVQKLEESRTVRKILKVDDHIYLAFAGLSADARVLVQHAQLQCQSFKYQYEDPMDVDFLVRYVAEVQQKSTQRGGHRPYAVGCIIGGFNADGAPQLWQTEPSGVSAAWRACATGKNAKTVIEEMEKQDEEGKLPKTRDETVRFAIRALLEVVESGSKNIEVVVLKRGEKATTVNDAELTQLTAELEKEREEARAKKRAQQEDQA
jgi:20S proteasome subunit alpha 4